MTAWVTLADFGTAIGTLVLAGATFVSVRASARSTRIAERALLAGQRPVLVPAGLDDPAESVQFADGRVFPVGNGQALAERDGEVVYLAIPLRNVGAGLAVLRGYHLQGESAAHVADDPRGPARHLRGDPPPHPEAFSPQQRDLLISTRRAGFWQAALRDPGTRLHGEVTRASRPGGGLPSTYSTETTRAASLPSPASCCCPKTAHGGATLPATGACDPAKSYAISGSGSAGWALSRDRSLGR